jgi:hypothetical protein
MAHLRQRPTNIIFREHMEEDDPTPRALPRWVELEYTVSTTSPSLRPLHASFLLAFGANELGWTRNLAPHSLTDETWPVPMRTHDDL